MTRKLFGTDKIGFLDIGSEQIAQVFPKDGGLRPQPILFPDVKPLPQLYGGAAPSEIKHLPAG